MNRRPSVEVAEVAEISEILDRLGVHVRLEGKNLVVEGHTNDPVADAALETLRGREHAMRRALALPAAARAKLAEKRNADREAGRGKGRSKARKGETA